MQGTIALLIAMGGLGCHHKSCAPVVAETCYTSCHSSCYSSGASSCYASTQVVVATSQSCYSGSDSCYSSCYSGGSESCYSSCYASQRRKCGLFGGGGLFHHKRRAQVSNDCGTLGVVDSCYSMPVYGSYTPAYATGQGSWGAPQGTVWTAPQTAPAGGVMPPPPVTAAPADAVAPPTAPATPPAAPKPAEAVPAAPKPADAVPTIPKPEAPAVEKP